MSDQPEELRRFLLDIQAIIESEGNPEFAEEQPQVLQRFVGYDDIWWTMKMREAAIAQPADPWLGLVCARRAGPISLWKRVLDFPADLEAWNKALPLDDDLNARLAWEGVRAELEDNDVLLVRHSFRPWEPLDKTDPQSESVLGIWDLSAGELIPLTRISPIVKGLRSAWMGDLQVHAFAAREDHVSAAEVMSMLSEVVQQEEVERG
jgi:hypothetical protein